MNCSAKQGKLDQWVQHQAQFIFLMNNRIKYHGKIQSLDQDPDLEKIVNNIRQ